MTVTFVTNGGTSVTKLENVEELPTPLPTTTKTNNLFVGWFYDSGFEEQAYSGDELTANITLYAKWYANMEDFYQDVADEIRIKNGETEPIKHTDFAYKIKNIQGAKPEETKTVTPDFSSGNVVVTPTSGKVMSQVTINKDSNLIANNIKKDVTVHGITGTLESGGGVNVLNAPILEDWQDGILGIGNTNGNFAQSYRVYSNGTLMFTVDCQIGYTEVLLTDHIPSGIWQLDAVAIGEGWQDSPSSAVITIPC